MRELENVLTRAAILARGSTIGPTQLTLGRDGASTAGHADAASENGATEPEGPADMSVSAVIADHVQRVLAQTGGNKSEAARLLDISRSRLARILSKTDDDE